MMVDDCIFLPYHRVIYIDNSSIDIDEYQLEYILQVLNSFVGPLQFNIQACVVSIHILFCNQTIVSMQCIVVNISFKPCIRRILVLLLHYLHSIVYLSNSSSQHKCNTYFHIQPQISLSIYFCNQQFFIYVKFGKYTLKLPLPLLRKATLHFYFLYYSIRPLLRCHFPYFPKFLNGNDMFKSKT